MPFGRGIQTLELALVELGSQRSVAGVADQVATSQHARSLPIVRHLVVEVRRHEVERQRATEAVRVTRYARVHICLACEHECDVYSDTVHRFSCDFYIDQQ